MGLSSLKPKRQLGLQTLSHTISGAPGALFLWPLAPANSVLPPLLCDMSDEAGLPKATVNKVIKDCLPADLKIAAEVRDLVADASLGTSMRKFANPFLERLEDAYAA